MSFFQPIRDWYNSTFSKPYYGPSVQRHEENKETLSNYLSPPSLPVPASTVSDQPSLVSTNPINLTDLTNDRLQASADKAMDFSAQQAQLDRDFQERMSSTAYQRALADVKAAGLSPILAFGNPASTPGGSSAAGASASFHDLGGTANEHWRNVIKIAETALSTIVDVVGLTLPSKTISMKG